MTDHYQPGTLYTVVYDVRGDRQKHDEWWRMIHRLPNGISIKASASFDALAKLDELEGGMVSNEQQNQTAEANTLATQCPKCCGAGSIIYLGAPSIVCVDCGGGGRVFAWRDSNQAGRYVEAAPERLAPILAELDATHEAAVRRVIAQFGDDSYTLATEIVRLRGELMASGE